MSEEAKTIVKNEWLQILVMSITMAGLFLWARSESKDDYRHMDAQVQAIHYEIKDFHGRLIAIEERNKIKEK